MNNPEFIPLRRIHPDANEQARRQFGRRLLAALDAAGVRPDEEFVIGPASILPDSPSRDAATRVGDIIRQAQAVEDADAELALW